jgi:hypothetical protein
MTTQQRNDRMHKMFARGRQTKALNLAFRILDAFKEAGNIYDDYQQEEGFTDDAYEEMLSELRLMTGR